MADPAHGRNWANAVEGNRSVVTLSGDWIARETGVEAPPTDSILGSGSQSLAFRTPELGHWDSGLLAFLAPLRDAALRRGVAFEEAGLPKPARQLLSLISEHPAATPAGRALTPVIDRVGLWALAIYAEILEVMTLIGESVLQTLAAVRGRAAMRRSDLVACMVETGASALPIVIIVNVLVGGILAFAGSVQLHLFGADIYVASLVGVAVVREMAALMTAIIVAGRTGGAYAANIATMQGNEEIDALQVIGIPVFDYLILPRILALTTMMPILYLFGCAVGMIGGFLVAVTMLSLSAVGYFDETRNAVSGVQFVLGLSKSVSFGALIAIAGCRVGLRAGRSAADVGHAATTAVVAGIVGVIALDAVFAVCAKALGV